MQERHRASCIFDIQKNGCSVKSNRLAYLFFGFSAFKRFHIKTILIFNESDTKLIRLLKYKVLFFLKDIPLSRYNLSFQ